MHGISDKARLEPSSQSSLTQRVLEVLWRRRAFMLIVILPTLILTAYFVFIAADQYESEAQFLVRSAEAPKQPTIGIQAFGIDSKSDDEAVSISEYLSSHDAVAWLRRHNDLVARFRRPEADIFSRLWHANPTPEALQKFYEKQVQVEINPETSLVVMRVRSFRPQDSHAIATALLALGERRVNELNARMNNASLAQARQQLAEAENSVAQIQRRMTEFRQRYNNIDPVATGGAQIELVTRLTGILAQARAERASMARFVDASSPQLLALDARVRALSAQVASAQSTLSGNSNAAIAARVGDYQELQLRQQFEGKRYDAAAAQYQRARSDLEKQQLYVVQVVDPNLPVKSTYPKSFRTIATVFFCLLLLYGIGWLLVAGVREHTA